MNPFEVEAYKSLYIDLDAILDTRLPFLYLLTDGKKVGEIDYYNRIKDNFGTIPDKVFKYYYKFRNKNILTKAMPTAVFELITPMIQDFILLNKKGEKFNIYLNTYPYTLNVQEFANLRNVFEGVYDDIELHHLCQDKYKLDLGWLINNVDIFVMYDGLEWLNYKILTGELLKNAMLDKMMITPFIIEGLGNLEMIEGLDDRLISAHFRFFIDLKLVDIKTFNALIGKDNYYGR